ncbi:glycoside hydrolase family 125 protein [Flavisolibacter tropicus]|uniref:Tat pathway signal protein n=1 Tax=Flavisolibacter tropicus TaxID=1492898 RepID=A0A172TSY8_9BACT|nr:glycoside hydrolase family 125 protein [Flavisolibacter tropicus]ANE50004.1 Tat pathway signal protein [Flavisolibacter tropicus]
MKRRQFIKASGILSGGLILNKAQAFAIGYNDFETKRPPLADRHFTSLAVEATIEKIKKQTRNKELAWLFENCYPNTLDTTVYYKETNGRPDTYVITGDIDAMWMRDSTAQVWPYLALVREDVKLQKLIEGVINRHTRYIYKDPYANAFYNDENKVSEWKDDLTDMKSGVHERKWEIDSLCYPIRLAYAYWKKTGHTAPFDNEWKEAISLIVKTFKEQQRKGDRGPYHFQRNTAKATDTLPLQGYGYPVKPVGLICSAFRPSDDATVYSFLIPSNFFAVVSLRQAAEMLQSIHKDSKLATECTQLANEVNEALKVHATAQHPQFGKVFAFEADGFGNHLFMDDANVPSLLSLPYLGSVSKTDPVYLNTRKMILSESNPFFFKGKAAEGIGGPHVAVDMIWPLSIIMRGLTSSSEQEIKYCIDTLQKTHGGKGFMHESFHKDDPTKYTRDWFAWANTIFGEFVLQVAKERPRLIG